MSDKFVGVAAFLLSGTWSTVWPFLVLPLAGVMLLRAALRDGRPVWTDPRSQMRMAALAASVPGLITLMLAAGYAARGIHSPESFTCFAKFFGPPILLGAFLLRAATVLGLRRARLERVMRLTRLPSERLARLAAGVGVPALEIAADASICFVAGWHRPRVVISTGALRRLSDRDVRAALLHERAHMRRGDAVRRTLVTIASECGLWPSRRALALYRLGKEALADAEAAREVGETAVADVLVRFARGAIPVPAAAQLAERDGLARRVQLLVGGAQVPAPKADLANDIAFRLAAALSLGLFPFAARFIERFGGWCGPR